MTKLEVSEIQRLNALLDERTMALMERESDLADRLEEIEAQKEELTAAVEELDLKNKTLESALEKLKERNYELDQILYRASHDLRTPVTSIVGILNVLEYESLGAFQKQCVQHISTKTSQMDDLLKSLTAFSKTISNDVHFSLINLDSTVHSCLHELRHVPNFSSVRIQNEIDKSIYVTTDKMLFMILVKNLVTNSLTFRNPKKEGNIAIRSVMINDCFEIEITDDGEGIADSIKDKIFDMFFRGSELSQGSGLGLYIVKKIVERLNGHIQFTSENGITRFNVILPQRIIE